MKLENNEYDDYDKKEFAHHGLNGRNGDCPLFPRIGRRLSRSDDSELRPRGDRPPDADLYREYGRFREVRSREGNVRCHQQGHGRPNRDTIYSWSVFDVTSPLIDGSYDMPGVVRVD